MTEVPNGLEGKVFLVKGKLQDIVEDLAQKGYQDLYIDGGKTIQSFLKEDLIDELIISTIPVLLGGGISLFGELDKPLKFKHESAERYADCIVKNRFMRA